MYEITCDNKNNKSDVAKNYNRTNQIGILSVTICLINLCKVVDETLLSVSVFHKFTLISCDYRSALRKKEKKLALSQKARKLNSRQFTKAQTNARSSLSSLVCVRSLHHCINHSHIMIFHTQNIEVRRASLIELCKI